MIIFKTIYTRLEFVLSKVTDDSEKGIQVIEIDVLYEYIRVQ